MPLEILNRILILIALTSCLSFEPVTVDQYAKIGDKCMVRKYKYSKSYIGPIGPSIESNGCDNIIGNSPKDYARVAEFLDNYIKSK